jgi:ferredoxin-thioredoxin reductase catalytic subunit
MSDVKNWKIQKVKLANVKMRPDNPRAIGDKALEGLRHSLERFGYVEPIIWNKTTGHIVGGHQRYFVLVEQGVEEAKMVVIEMSLEEELAANLTLNNPEIEGTWSDEAIDLLHQVETSDTELFNSLNMDALKTSLEKTPNIDPGKKEEKSEGDTECPCCHHKWDIRAEDVSVGSPK